MRILIFHVLLFIKIPKVKIIKLTKIMPNLHNKVSLLGFCVYFNKEK